MKPRDVVHRVMTGHWPRWAPDSWYKPYRYRRCRECGYYEIHNGRRD